MEDEWKQITVKKIKEYHFKHCYDNRCASTIMTRRRHIQVKANSLTGLVTISSEMQSRFPS